MGFLHAAAFILLAAIPAQAPQPLTLEAALAAAEQSNPTLVAARLGRAIDVAGIGVARERPNPEFAFETGRDTPHEAFTVGVPFELGGKRARRIELANAAVARTAAEILVQALDVRRAVRLAYYDLVAAQRRVQTSADLREFAERARNAARDRFQSGAAPRLEALQAELVLAQANNEEEAARGRLTAARIELNALIGRPVGASSVPSDSFDGGTAPSDIATAVLASPDIAALDRAIDEALASERLARAMQKPDPIVSGGLLLDAQPEFMYGWKFGLDVTLPLFTRHTAAVQVETARIAQLRARREARIAELTGQAGASAARADAARRQYLRYRDEILPQLATIESMAEDSYRSGQSGLAALIQALQAARELRLRATDAGLDYQAALADLERALGGPIR